MMFGKKKKIFTKKDLSNKEKNTLLFSLAMAISRSDQYFFNFLFNYIIDIYAPGDYTPQSVQKVPKDILGPMIKMQTEMIAKLSQLKI